MTTTDDDRATQASIELLELSDLEPETLMDHFAARGWGDGLPLVPPTVDRVERMLAHAPGDSDEILGAIAPRGGVVTRRSVAVNGVLAGCPPEVMPVLVAVAGILGDGSLDIAAINPTTHPVAPLVIVHGEAIDQLGFNAREGTFGPGNRANASVGRAVRLMLMHIGGAVPGRTDRSTHGQPSKYAFCIAENHAASPWESYPSSRGIDSASSVTVAAVENPLNIHDMESQTPEGVLDKIASNIASLGSNHVPLGGAEIWVAIGPEHAATIAQSKWTREDVCHYLYQRARLPRSLITANFANRREPRWMRGLGDDELAPLTDTPDSFRVLVTGGAGKHSQVLPSFGLRPTSVTRAIATH